MFQTDFCNIIYEGAFVLQAESTWSPSAVSTQCAGKVTIAPGAVSILLQKTSLTDELSGAFGKFLGNFSTEFFAFGDLKKMTRMSAGTPRPP